MSNSNSDILVLDTETTALDDKAEIVEISIKNLSNQEVFHSYIMPVGEISLEAYNVHGISKQTLAARNAPFWSDVASSIKKAVGNKTICAYNAKFDKRLAEQTSSQQGVVNPLENNPWICASIAANNYLGKNPKSESGHHRLTDAFAALCPELKDVPLNAHSASDDVFMTVAVARALIHKQVPFGLISQGTLANSVGRFEQISAIKTVFIDMDGVLCDWEKSFQQITGHNADSLSMLDKKEQLEHVSKMSCEYSSHYAELEPIVSNLIFIREMMKAAPDVEFKILTSVGKHNIEHMIEQKKQWLGKHFPEINTDKNFRYTIRSKDKAYYAAPGVCLIDDFKMVRELFAENGGLAVDGSNFKQTADFFHEFCDVKTHLNASLHQEVDTKQKDVLVAKQNVARLT